MKWEGLGTNYDLNKSFDHTCRGDESVTGDYVSSEEQSKAGSFQEAEAKGQKNIYFDGTDDGLFSWFQLVTILVAAKGVYQVPAIRSTEDMKGALRSLNVDAKELEVAVEVFWAPQAENDTLPEQEFLQNYPRLSPDKGICSKLCELR
ncbi:hypothetical protein OIU76_014041 [Salix suchowensis]|nr:hypothetical protein OIU76_014041 [Salix suchowensis]